MEYQSKSYTKIIVANETLETIYDVIRHNISFRKAVIITDDIVDDLYAEDISDKFRRKNKTIIKYVITNGETSKNIDVYHNILSFLVKNKINRMDIILAIGGGVVTDLAGFVTNSYLRGIKFVNVPTTLIGMVDASLGGKNGINLNYNKNYIGSFYHPEVVICDVSIIRKLPEELFNEGLSEMIKYGVICDPKILEIINHNKPFDDLFSFIISGIECKQRFIEHDEKDKGKRQLLNFGHTIGHALEKCSDFKINHGTAVAFGMICESFLSYKLGFCSELDYEYIKSVIKKIFNININIGIDRILEEVVFDKKNTDDLITIILPNEIGDCSIRKINYGILVSHFTNFNIDLT